MSKEHPANKAASVRDKLYNLSRQSERNFQEIVQYYAMERFLYRLGQSEFQHSFILKGALMLRVWMVPQARATMDIDLLGKLDNSASSIEECIKMILNLSVPDDGLVFDPKSVSSMEITQDADYRGRRILFLGYMEQMRIRMKIDIGFSDIVLPAPVPIHFPTALDMDAPILLGYTRESAIAEKFHAMVFLGLQNSRMKDFYDIYVLSNHHSFEGNLLCQSLQATFKRRHLNMPSSLIITSSSFLKMKEVQWAAFLKKFSDSLLSGIPGHLEEIVQRISSFLLPPCQALLSKEAFEKTWNPLIGGWDESTP
ncbi:nucleotidyl transferase AbiEii/AbiGii toxin family protein [Akkermansia glycaniphila]|uniref:Nucleotidyl transferase abieii toxin type iv ta system n=1 Tax=Akkermansia glycaniphila TaxID=1679444 RepID=A0A1C7PFF1_9BACT|nr:nucleotidyl transferase AbiEii/AbiGii toxin family protein [Akkermansia glycaniphila]OCA02752.1 hypothetical protein AC781_08660 [Akkermansia glycaniphila]SEH99851.1 nucleotidyl transferase abieii toxin type iv ta system [Akkermansia glycaniphila]